MNLNTLLNVAQLIFSILLCGAILIQNQGSGLGMAFGGDSNVYRTKRGIEKSLYNFTIIVSILFLGTALVNFIY